MAGLHSNVPLLCGGTSTLLRSEDGFVDNVDDELSAGQDCWHPGWVWLAGCSTIHHPQWFSINGRDEKNINFIQFLWLHGIVLPMPPKWPPCWWTVSQLIFVLLPQMRMYYIYIYMWAIEIVHLCIIFGLNLFHGTCFMMLTCQSFGGDYGIWGSYQPSGHAVTACQST